MGQNPFISAQRPKGVLKCHWAMAQNPYQLQLPMTSPNSHESIYYNIIILISPQTPPRTRTYQQTLAGRSWPPSIRVCSGRSYNRWSFHYTDRYGWRNGWAIVPDHRVRRAGTEGRAGARPPPRTRTVRAPCWSHTGRCWVQTAPGSTVRSWVLRVSHTLWGTERSRPPRPQAPKSSTATLSKKRLQTFYARLI